MEVNATFIAKVSSDHTGGGCMADVIELKSGAVFIIADECAATYRNLQHWHEDGGDTMVAMMTEVIFDRVDAPSGFSELGLTFVDRITTYEPDGPVSVDLLHLPDGRVIGVDAEGVVLYPSIDAFNAITESGEVDESWPSIPFEGGAQ